ncbi:DNA recombination protein RmuC [Nocardioides maradonensis]
MVVVVLLMGLVVGAVVGALAMRQRAEVAAGPLRDELARTRTELVEAHADAVALRQSAAAAEQLGQAHLDAALARVREQEAGNRSALQSELASAQATLTELREALAQAQAQHRQLVEEGRRTQAEREKAESGQTQVLKTLTPVLEHLRSMQGKVDDLERARVKQHTELATQIQQTQRSVEESRKAADTLSQVLKNNAVRGAWGETQLRTLVETAGLLNRVDFDLQASVVADSGDRRPDMVINLPGGKQMAIDAKVPYNAFMDAQREGIDPEARQRLLEDHARKVRGHVDVLARKGYWTGLDVSPEFTVAFIPNEQLLNAALEVDPSLMEHAFKQGIVLATPTNLWGLLKTVAFTWKQEALTEDAQHLFELGQQLYRRILKLAEHVDKLGRSIQRSVKDYNAFTGSLERSVLPAARKLNAADPISTIPAPMELEEAPRSLTAGDFEAIADIERDELTFDFSSTGSGQAAEITDAEIVEDRDAG